MRVKELDLLSAKEIELICTNEVKARLKESGVDENSELRLWYDDWGQTNITANGRLVIRSSNPFQLLSK
jgi:hypothetical protein